MTAAEAAPAGYQLDRLSDRPDSGHAEARRFCLDTIAAFYGIDYRPDWHADLDGLLLPAGQNHYAAGHRGAFWVLRDAAGAVAATAGVRHLGWKPGVLAMFPRRYKQGEAVASLWRVYVREDLRRHGLGRRLTRLCEAEALGLGYAAMYLHASSDTPATLAFWRAAGYGVIGTCETSTHFEKRIEAVAPLGRNPGERTSSASISPARG